MTDRSVSSAGSLKIALICDWFLPQVGGTEMHLRDLALRLRGLGHEVHVITSFPGERRVDGIPVHRLNVPLFPRFKLAWTPAVIRKLEALLKEARYDVVHCHGNIVSPVAYGGAYLLRKLGIPGVITWNSILGPYRLIFAVLDGVFRWSKWPILVSGVSEVVAADVKALTGPDAVFVLPAGVDPLDWRVTPVERDANEIWVVSVMRLYRKKRGKALIKWIPKILRRIPDQVRLKVKIVGEGPDREKMEKWIARYGLEQTVELLGYQTREQIGKIFSRADIFVQPTIWESFGIAALEARSAGLPVVARREGGIREFVCHGKEGLLAETDGEMVDHLVRLVTDSGQRLSIARHNRETPPLTGWGQVLSKHLDVYRKAIDLKRNSSKENPEGKVAG